MTCPATTSAAVTTAGPAAANPLRSTMITLSTCFYGLRMNLRSATCGRNHETWRSEAQPRWKPAEIGPSAGRPQRASAAGNALVWLMPLSGGWLPAGLDLLLACLARLPG